MSLLSRDAIIADLGLKSKRVKAWGGEVIVSEMTGMLRERWESLIFDDRGQLQKSNLRAKLLVCCLVDEEGNPLFSAEDHELLGRKDSRTIQRLHEIARELNPLDNSDVEDAKND